MAGTMWLATREYGQWVPCPRINMQAGKISWGTLSRYLNGGTYSRRSTAAAKQYTMEWGLKSRDELRPVLDFTDGFYGTGDLYFLDPFAMDKNVLPAHWAAGYINAVDGPLTAATIDDWPPSSIAPNPVRPDLVSLGSSTNGFPTSSGGSRGQHTLFIPLPPGYSIHWSCHAPVAAAGGAIEINVLTAGVVTSGPFFPSIEALTTNRLQSFSTFASAPHMGVEITLRGTINYTGMMAQILPTGTLPNYTQAFKSGQGHSGLQVQEPGVEYFEYSSALDLVQASLGLVEVGSWR